MKSADQERNDWNIVLIVLVIGFLAVVLAGQLALRFAPSWQLETNMESHLDPNSAFLTERPNGLIEPVDASILTRPSWIDGFLTPGVPIITGTPPQWTSTSSPAPTAATAATNTPVIAASSTKTLIFIPATPTPTRKLKPTKTSHSFTATYHPPTLLPSMTPTSLLVFTFTPTTTQTMTTTPTSTATPTATSTPTSTPVPIPTDPFPPEIGITPDGVTYDLPAGGALTLGINLVATGDASYDLVYYEYPAGSGILMDWAIVEISDGTNWYTIFYWGNDIADTNSNLDFTQLPNPVDPPEQDQLEIPASVLYNSTGIAIDIDSIVPSGTYSYIRFSAPVGDADGQMEIDAIEVFP